MKKLLLLLLFVAAGTASRAQASSNEVIYKHWAFLGESDTYLDVSYRVIRCGSVNEVQLQVFNENPNDQVGRFELEIVNVQDGARFTREITHAVKGAAIVQGDCNGGAAVAGLRITLPSGYDPTNLSVKITFKP